MKITVEVIDAKIQSIRAVPNWTSDPMQSDLCVQLLILRAYLIKESREREREREAAGIG